MNFCFYTQIAVREAIIHVKAVEAIRTRLGFVPNFVDVDLENVTVALQNATDHGIQ